MKRTPTLLALVALVAAFLALQSFQPAARPRATRPHESAHRVSRVLTGQHCAPIGRPQVKTAGEGSSPHANSPTDEAAAAHDTQTPGDDAPGPDPTNGAPGATPASPQSDDTSRGNEPESPAEPQLTPEEKELKRKREGRASLNWLRDHQSEDGRWSASDFGAASVRTQARHTHNVEFYAPGLDWGDKGQSPDNDMAVTALVLLAHLGTGYDYKDGDYKESMRRALQWMRAQQHENGRFGPEHDNAFLPTHALCTAAITECYGLSGDAALKDNCERAAKHLLGLQTKDSGFARKPNGWGLEAEPDVATTAWSVLALKTARMAGIEIELAAPSAGVLKFLDAVTDCVKDADGNITYVRTRLRERGGEAPDYRDGRFVSMPTLNAMNAFCRGVLGDSENQPDIGKALATSAILENAAWIEHQIDFLHFYFASAAAYQWLGSSFRRVRKTGPDKGHSEWELTLVKTLNDNQRGFKPDELKTWPATLDEFGSWDTVDAYSRQGGRVYITAMACLTLQIYYYCGYQRISKD